MAVTVLTGLTQGAKAYQLSKVIEQCPRIFVLSANEMEAELLTNDFRLFTKDQNSDVAINHFKDWATIPFELTDVAVEHTAARIKTILQTPNAKRYCIFSSVPAVIRKILPREIFTELGFTLEINNEYSRSDLIEKFLFAGFTRVSLVQTLGNIAIRGNVIDFFPIGYDHPIRLEFFDNRLEKIKLFNTESQRSIDYIANITVDPLKEVYPLARKANFSENLIVSKLKELAAKYEINSREANKICASIKDELILPGLEIYLQMVTTQLNTIFDYLAKDTLLVVNENYDTSEAINLAYQQVKDQHHNALEQGLLVPEIQHAFLNPEQLLRSIESFNSIYLNNPGEAILNSATEKNNFDFRTHSELTAKLKITDTAKLALEPLKDIFKYWQSSKFKTIFVVGSKARQTRLQSLLEPLHIKAELSQGSLAELIKTSKIGTYICLGQLSEGFTSAAEKLAILSEAELFQRRSVRTGAASVSPSLKKIISELEQLTIDDFIVHQDFGIGQFIGLVHLTVDGSTGDFLQINYADSTLYLPAHNINKIQKYLGIEGVEPELDRLSSGKWNKTKIKVQKAAAEIAGDLLNLYAQRALIVGHQFEAYNQLDQEFAEQFPFDETPDQLSAIQDTLNDMAQPRPMDRLICGDVGFGKTEVAIRAAFKAIQAGKQVAVLAPTTILVEQHFNSFKERFTGLPVKIGVLSRFHSTKSNAATLDGAASGELDIIIGTHKILGRSVHFKDLGLLVIDEEHRFGVKQKEQLKNLKKSVDVLTLTATPIPRTLHMAMCNVRDISVISTPPVDRRVIQTHVSQREDNLIRSVLLREHQRGGQAFFVHNRVQTLPTIIHNLKELCPELKFDFAHGQMKETDLEDAMRRFISRETDVLVCTSIIESGLDIPNANTIIMDRADMFGLAQLYQLRGRVGRSNQQAYCYFLVPTVKKLNPDAHKRLKALQNLDDLGLGFNLALRDLEIRGAGNILGREQSGNVFLVGYELYSKILNEAILNLKGETPSLSLSIDPEIKLNREAFLPEFYIPDVSERLLVYQRFSAVLSFDELDQLIEELEDRFGSFGQEVQSLVEFMRIRVFCRNFSITKLEKQRDRLYIYFHPQTTISGDKILALVNNGTGQFRLAGNQGISTTWHKDFESAQILLKFLADTCAGLLRG